MKVGNTGQMLVLQAEMVGQFCDYFGQSTDWSEIYHRSRTKKQDRTSGMAWKPKIHAKVREIRVEIHQRWL